ncbi:hypothetical protein HLB25_10325 [Dickeya dadantii]|uniref:hypothetical protein n=1 Tax=Dickeya dadantii TaxID=204038 RepID=UPI0014959E41|nr:hypothetical protein [Dickeya dadantii]NPE55905.1 hypothetical protein [Dickeya dadantii]NPE67129.1 hypothetical protein [Dickeya dadantii]
MNKSAFITLAILMAFNSMAIAENNKEVVRVLDLKVSFLDSCKKNKKNNVAYVSLLSGKELNPVNFDIITESEFDSSYHDSFSALLSAENKSDKLDDKFYITMRYTINSIDGFQEIGEKNSSFFFVLPISSKITRRISTIVEKNKPSTIITNGSPCKGSLNGDLRYKLTLELL